ALHGAAILIHRIWNGRGYKMPAILGWALTLFSVNIFWVFFRAKDLAGSVKVLKAMVDYKSIGSFITESYKMSTEAYLGNKISLLILLIGIFTSILLKNSYDKKENMKLKVTILFETTLYISIGILLLDRVASFLYFNF
ncbi:MAG: MBOAT family protein, partial [Fusobacteriaceae bacterium]